eukprot:XP_023973534.1 uncharacterized protein LOC112062809 [Physeter catodon]
MWRTAVVGMACRLPGTVNSSDDLWKMLGTTIDCIQEIPPSRFDVEAFYDPDPDVKGKMYVREGGFISGGEKFDSKFFGISDAEAREMDPRQRISLEVSYEAFVDGGYCPEEMRGAAVGVYVGAMNHDKLYDKLESHNSFSGTSNALAVLANRVSFFLGLTGASVTIDTACSSSLVAADFARISLALESFQAAVVIGINLLPTPDPFVQTCKAKMLSPDCRCKTFDASANGYVRSEGCCAVLLQQVREREASKKDVYGWVLGTANNHVGRSASLTAPNGPAQQAVIRAALRSARVNNTTSVVVVETHGTGTALGDPIEVGALQAVYGRGTCSDSPLVLGALKSRIGHTEGAAGLAGFIKLILCLRHRVVPPNLHLKRFNPHIEIDTSDNSRPFLLPTKSCPLDLFLKRAPNETLVGAVSSFGFGGSNAHAIVEVPCAQTPLSEALVAQDQNATKASGTKMPMVWLFTGQGSQYVNMGKELYDGDAVFRNTVQQCSAYAKREHLLPPAGPSSIEDLIYPKDSVDPASAERLLEATEYSQIAIFVVELAISRMLQAAGIFPSAVLGHSLGEYAAATIAGVMKWEDALRLVAHRARVMAEQPRAEGIMAACRLSAADVQETLSAQMKHLKCVALAADNGPRSIVLSGSRHDVEQVLQHFGALSTAKLLNVSHAFHSPLMSGAVSAVEELFGGVELSNPVVPMFSTVLGRQASADEVKDPSYWAQQVVRPVLFRDAFYAAQDGVSSDVTFFLEIGPKRVLSNLGLVCSRSRTALTIETNGTFLVTGGLGGLGLVVARWLARRKAQAIVLLSRSGRPTPTVEQSEDWKQLFLQNTTTQVATVKCDVANKADIKTVLQAIQRGTLRCSLTSRVLALPPLRGIFHVAGVLDDRPLLKQNQDSVDAVFAPKVHGAWNLHEALEELHMNGDLAFFVMFSSIAALVGNAGQANYAAANACLDALAQYRRSRGLAGQSIQWGPWTEQGMAADLKDRLARLGFGGITNEDGIKTLEQLLLVKDVRASVVACQQFFWGAFFRRYSLCIPGMFESQKQWASTVADHEQQGTKRTENRRGVILSGMSADEQKSYIFAKAASAAKHVLGSTDDPSPDAPLQELGIDSLAAVEFRNALQTALDVKLAATLLFDYPTLQSLTDFLFSLLQARASNEGVVSSERRGVNVDRVILETGDEERQMWRTAVVGMACRLPGTVNSSDDLWKMLGTTIDCIQEIPPSRFDVEAFYDPDPDVKGKMYVREGGFISGGEKFDSKFFGISDAEAREMDPRQRISLEVSYEAFVDGGYCPEEMRGAAVGVYVGAMNHDKLYDKLESHNSFSGTSNALAVLANRVSFFLGLTGASVTIDTACSSSLVAADFARISLALESFQAAVVIGINLLPTPDPFVQTCKAKMLSPDCRCKTFDASANGYVRSEGCCAVLLQQVREREASKKDVYGWVLGTANNHVGRSASLTAPNGPAQQAVIRAALRSARVNNTTSVVVVETHGTGTALGDPIEVGALQAVYGRGTCSDSPLVLGALKSRIGHTEGAAGLAGFIKLILCLRHRVVPPNLHLKRFNPHIEIDTSDNSRPFLLPTKSCPLDLFLKRAPNETLVGAVSSFGFGGSNAHAIVEVPCAQTPLSEALVAQDQNATKASGTKMPMVWLFTGQGSQYVNMGKELYDGDAVFRNTVQQCSAYAKREHLLPPAGPSSIEDLIYPKDSVDPASAERLLEATEYSQIAIFVVELAISRMLQAAGIFPSAVLGHSLGEYAAATIAGVMKWEDALRLVAYRARVMAEQPRAEGIMAACRLSAADVQETLSAQMKHLKCVALAADNGPRSIVLSGSRHDVEQVLQHFGALSTAKLLNVSHAFHSPLMSGAVSAVEELFGGVELSNPVVPVFSTVLGRQASADEVKDPSYWAQQVVRPVLFREAASAIGLYGGNGGKCYIEVGPRGILCSLAQACLSPTASQASTWHTVVDKNSSAWKSVLVDLQNMNSDEKSGMPRRELKTWDHRLYPWNIPAHPLLRNKRETLGEAVGSVAFEATTRSDVLTMLSDHQILGTPMLPGAAFLDLMLNVGRLAAARFQGRPATTAMLQINDVLDDRPLLKQNQDSVDAVFAPKVHGAWNLHEALEELHMNGDLAFFVMFSSIAALVGNAGQANYAAANACLDALAQYRRSRGLAGQSIQWGPWTEQGMAADLKDRLARLGFGGITNEDGIKTLEQLLLVKDVRASVVACQQFFWGAFFRRYSLCIPGMFESQKQWASTVADHEQQGTKRTENRRGVILSGMSADEQKSYIFAKAASAAKHVLGSTDDPSPDAPLQELGIDSLAAVEFRNALQTALDVKLAATLLFDYPTLQSLTDFLFSLLQARASNEGVVSSERRGVNVDRVILETGDEERQMWRTAVVGMACRLPGTVNSSDDLWKMLGTTIDCIQEIPPSRFDVEAFYDPDPDVKGKMYVREGGFISGGEKFDSKFFGISDAEAREMDPRQRISLEVSYEAFVDGGYCPEEMRGAAVGVYVGAMNHDKLYDKLESHNSFSGTSNALAVLANRVSFFLGLTGASVTIDTACSSSLVAADFARISLALESFQAAVVIGINLLPTPDPFVQTCKAKMLSPDCRCKTFDASANGYVRSEGCCAVLLQQVREREASKKDVYGWVLGTANNHVGRSASLTAPNGPAQQAVIRAALRSARVNNTTSVVVVETHGTGTALGDPIEVGALQAVYGRGTCSDSPLVLGALKSRIGHTEGAAGLAGFIKLILCLRHRVVPPNLHLKRFNPHIEIDTSDNSRPFLLPTKSCPLDLFLKRAPNETLVGAVSSFGFGGSNAHAIVEVPCAQTPLSEALVAQDQNATKASGTKMPMVWLFTGQGSQYVNMGKELYDGDAVFRNTVQQCSAYAKREHLLPPAGPSSIEDLIYPKDSVDPASAERLLEATEYSQIAIFVVELAISRMLQAAGIFPSAVLGHSLGEYAAATIAGVMKWEDALRLVAYRARVMAEQPRAEGIMAACRLSAADVQETLSAQMKHLKCVALAADNGPRSIVLSGSRHDVEQVLQHFGALSTAKLLNVSHAFHSPLMSGAVSAVEELFGGVELSNPVVPMFSTVLGRQASADEVKDPSYWAQQVVRPVLFREAASAIGLYGGNGGKCYIEVGPRGILCSLAQACLSPTASQASTWHTVVDKNSSSFTSSDGNMAQRFKQSYNCMQKTAKLLYIFNTCENSVLNNVIPYGSRTGYQQRQQNCSRSRGTLPNPRRQSGSYAGFPEAREMDPRQRISLEVSYEAFVDGGYCPEEMRGAAVGVYVGAMNHDKLYDKLESHNSFSGTSNALAVLANRVSFFLGLTGASVTIDTACSSSLVAADFARISLALESFQAAVVIGINLLPTPDPFVQTARVNNTTSVVVVETHGTGTALGDPIEVGALQAVYGRGTCSDSPLVLGALKSRIGHTEGAAGLAGFIKLILCLRHRVVPPNLHLKRFNPHIEIDTSDNSRPFLLPTKSCPLDLFLKRAPNETLVGAVSSFGFGGSNAHAIVEVPCAQTPLSEALVAQDQNATKASGTKMPMVWLFTGQGSQYVNMGKELYDGDAVFRNTVQQCSAYAKREHLLPPAGPSSIEDLIYPKDSVDPASAERLLEATEYSQIAIFVVELAISRMLQAAGIFPSAVLGHSLGEYAAATIAGVMKWEDALRLVAYRARVMAEQPRAEGIMAACRLSAADVQETLSAQMKHLKCVALAADNGPRSIVLSGSRHDVEQVLQHFGALSTAKLLNVSHAFHSPLMSGAVSAVEELFGGVELSNPVVPMFSTVLGRQASADEVKDPSYWAQQVVRPVLFREAASAIGLYGGNGGKCYIEVGPRGILCSLAQACLSPTASQASTWHTVVDKNSSSFTSSDGNMAQRFKQSYNCMQKTAKLLYIFNTCENSVRTKRASIYTLPYSMGSFKLLAPF